VVTYVEGSGGIIEKEELNMGVISMKQLLEAGVHFGHQTRRWNPKMDKYIYTSRGGIHIIDLQKTVVLVEEAYQKLLEIGKNGGKILLVGTKKQARDVVKAEAERTGQYYVSQRWLGGTLTNFKTIRKSIRKLHDLERMEKDGTFDRLTKKEVIGLRKETEKLEKFLSGIKEMRTLPEAIFVVDPMQEKNAVLEARKLGIPVFGIVDTNCDPDFVDVIIPGNDDAIRSVKLIVGKLADAFIIAAGGVVEHVEEPPREERQQRPRREYQPRTDRPKREYTPRTDRTPRPYTNSKPTTTQTTTTNTTTPKPQPKVEVAPKTEAKPTPQPKVEVAPKVEAKPTPQPKVEVAPKVEAKPTPVVETKKQEVPVKKEVTAKSVDLDSLTVADLRAMAKDKGLTGYSKLKKADLVEALK